MPIYEYACSECQKITETLRSMSDADKKIDCEHCGSKQTKRAQSVCTTVTGSSNSSQPWGSGCGTCGDPVGPCGSGACGLN